MAEQLNNKWWVLFTTCLLTVMLNFDATAVNLAIPVMAHQFHANLTDMQWVINAFVLVSAMFQILGGRSGDLYGHRRIYVIGTIIFVLSSLFAGLATEEWMLILGRIGQGFALGFAYPMTMVLIFKAFPKQQHGMAVGFVMGTMGVSLAIGPTLGGVILHYLSWRWIFLVNLPIGIFTVICTYLFFNPDQTSSDQPPLDYSGGIFLIFGLLGVILALNQAQNWGLNSAAFMLTLTTGLLCLLILYQVEKNKSYCLVDFKLFAINNFLLNNLIRIIAQMIFLPVLFFIPIYLQNILQFSSLYAGLLMLACTLFVGILSPFAGKLVDIIGIKIPNIISMIAFSVGCWLFVNLSATPNLPVLISGLALIGLATGINFVSTTSGALGAIPEKQSGMASGIFFTIVWGSCALGIAVYGTIMALSSKQYLLTKIAQLSMPVNRIQMDALTRVSKGLSTVDYLQNHFTQPLLAKFSSIAHAAFMNGFRVGFMVLIGLSIIGLILSMLTTK